MTAKDPRPLAADRSVALVVRRLIDATAERIFAAWTQPAQIEKWWGPETATCSDAEIDLVIGGRYRIANKFPDGTIVWIAGVFEHIEPPHKLVYSWQLEAHPESAERVTVRFAARGRATEVIITHERIADPAARDRHRQGWHGCLDGLTAYLEPA